MLQIKPNDIEQIMRDNQFQYIEIRDSSGKKYGGFNQTPKVLKKKVDSVKQFCKVLPNGIYNINFKINPSGDTFPYQFNKGNVKDEIVISESKNEPFTIHSPLERFQTLEEWKRQEKRINELESELAQLKMQMTFEAKLSEGAKTAEPEVNPILGFAQNVLPTFMPLIEKHFELQEKKLDIENKKINNGQQNTAQQAQKPAQKVVRKHPFRPVPELQSDQFNNYIQFLDKVNDVQLDIECKYLENNQPDILQWLNENYFENE